MQKYRLTFNSLLGYIKSNPAAYVHDCEKCVYLGPYQDLMNRWDLYVCPRNATSDDDFDVFIETLIARRSNIEYSSGVEFAIAQADSYDYHLTEALVRASLLGYRVHPSHYESISTQFKHRLMKGWTEYHRDRTDYAQPLHSICKNHQYALRKFEIGMQNLSRHSTDHSSAASGRNSSKLHSAQS